MAFRYEVATDSMVCPDGLRISRVDFEKLPADLVDEELLAAARQHFTATVHAFERYIRDEPYADRTVSGWRAAFHGGGVE